MEERTKDKFRASCFEAFRGADGSKSHAYNHAHVQGLHQNRVDFLYRIEYADGIGFMNYVAYTQSEDKR